MAEELVNTCAMICGQPDNLKTVTLVPGEGPDDLIAKYNEAIKEMDTTNRVIILNDLFGGSPYNAACRIAHYEENYRLCNGENANVKDAMEKAVEASTAGAQMFHKSQVEESTDDEGDDL